MSEWISVTDRLPKPFDAVLVRGTNPNRFTKGCEVAWIVDGIWTAWWTSDITHWIPIPEFLEVAE